MISDNRNFMRTSLVLTGVLLVALAVKNYKKQPTPLPVGPKHPEYLGPPLRDYQIKLHTDIPQDLKPWSSQVLLEAKEKLTLGKPCNQLWQQGSYRIRLVLTDEPLAVKAGNINLNIADGALAADGGHCFTLDYLVDTIKEMAQCYGRPIRYTSINGQMNGISGVDLLASALQKC